MAQRELIHKFQDNSELVHTWDDSDPKQARKAFLFYLVTEMKPTNQHDFIDALNKLSDPEPPSLN